jgi:hypothetical protein
MADPVGAAKDAANKVGSSALGVVKKVATLPLKPWFWAVAGVGVVACAAAAPAAVAAAAGSMAAPTSLSAVFSNAAAVTGTALTKGAPVLATEAGQLGAIIFGAVKTGVGAAVAGAPVPVVP